MDRWEWTPNPEERVLEMHSSRELWEEVFSEDSEEFLDCYDLWKCRDNRILTRHRAGKLVSMIHWNPYRIRLGSREADSYYLIAVATRPECRHQGLMRGLLQEGLENCRREGVPFVFLMPADPAIYTPFDFRFFYDRSVADVEDFPCTKRDLSCAEEENPLEIRPLADKEWSLVEEFLRRELAERFSIYALRSESYLRCIDAECHSEGGHLEGIFREGILVGCLSWWGDESIEIRELVTVTAYEQGDGAMLLWQAIGRRWEKAARITAVTTGRSGEKEPIIMGRIADLRAFMSPVHAASRRTLRLVVEDPMLSENQGEYIWRVGPEGSTLEGWKASEGMQSAAELRISIGDLFVWLTGYADLQELDSVRISEGQQSIIEEVRGFAGVFLTEIV